MSAVLSGTYRATAYQQLKTEFQAAILEGPESDVYTPGWNKSRAPVAEVINEEFCADSKSLYELLRIVRNAAKGADVRLQAGAWIDAESEHFAELHEAFRAMEIEAGQ